MEGKQRRERKEGLEKNTERKADDCGRGRTLFLWLVSYLLRD